MEIYFNKSLNYQKWGLNRNLLFTKYNNTIMQLRWVIAEIVMPFVMLVQLLPVNICKEPWYLQQFFCWPPANKFHSVKLHKIWIFGSCEALFASAVVSLNGCHKLALASSTLPSTTISNWKLKYKWLSSEITEVFLVAFLKGNSEPLPWLIMESCIVILICHCVIWTGRFWKEVHHREKVCSTF